MQHLSFIMFTPYGIGIISWGTYDDYVTLYTFTSPDSTSTEYQISVISDDCIPDSCLRKEKDIDLPCFLHATMRTGCSVGMYLVRRLVVSPTSL